MGMFKGGSVGSVNDLKESLDKVQEKIDNPTTWVKSIPEGEIRVRFLTEPDGWFEYEEHWSNMYSGYHACTGPTCPSCGLEGAKTSLRYLANAYAIKEVRVSGKNAGSHDMNRVIPLKIPLDVAQRLMTKYQRSAEDPDKRTMMDRDYTITRQGTGTSTMYDVDKEDPSSFTLDVELFDLEKILVDQYYDTFGEYPKGHSAPETKSAPKVMPRTDEDSEMVDKHIDNEGDEVPFEGESSDEDVLTLDDLRKMELSELVHVCEILKIDVPDEPTSTQLIDMIMETAE